MSTQRVGPAEVPRCVMLYKQAWEKRDVSLLKECFAEDAVYVFRPPEIKAPLCGLSEIEEYWQTKVVDETRNVRVEIVRGVYWEREAWFEWKYESEIPEMHPECRFQMWGCIILDIDPHGMIARLTEYYFWVDEQRQRLEAARCRRS